MPFIVCIQYIITFVFIISGLCSKMCVIFISQCRSILSKLTLLLSLRSWVTCSCRWLDWADSCQHLGPRGAKPGGQPFVQNASFACSFQPGLLDNIHLFSEVIKVFIRGFEGKKWTWLKRMSLALYTRDCAQSLTECHQTLFVTLYWRTISKAFWTEAAEHREQG